MNRLEYLLASAFLRLVGLIAGRLPIHPDRVVLVTARVSTLDGNLLYIHNAIRGRHPAIEPGLLRAPQRYAPAGTLPRGEAGARGEVGDRAVIHVAQLVGFDRHLPAADLLLAAGVVLGLHFSTGAPTRLPHSVHDPS